MPHWFAVLDPARASLAREIAWDVANRLRTTSTLEAAISAVQAQTTFPKSTHWLPHSVAQGCAGLAILSEYVDLCFPNEDWDLSGKAYLEIAARSLESQMCNEPGLFAGLSGIAFASWYLGRNGARYQRLLNTIDGILQPIVLDACNRLSETCDPISVSEFDAISGMSGIAAYLLCRSDDALSESVLHHVLRVLVRLTNDGDGLPRWHTPPHHLFDDRLLREYPFGNLNCGLAHGIPGPLAVMALAKLRGIDVAGLEYSIKRTADWLVANRLKDCWGINWPTAVPLVSHMTPAAPHMQDNEQHTKLTASRTAWCYGSPGIGRSLWLAGRALDVMEYRELSIDALRSVYRKPVSERNIDSPSFCHGVAGLLHITVRFAQDTRLDEFIEAARTLAGQLLDLYKPESLLGFRNREPNNNDVDTPGVLDGAAGIALALLASAGDREPLWDRLFLLS